MSEIPRHIDENYERVGFGIPVILGWVATVLQAMAVKHKKSNLYKKKKTN